MCTRRVEKFKVGSICQASRRAGGVLQENRLCYGETTCNSGAALRMPVLTGTGSCLGKEDCCLDSDLLCARKTFSFI